jgi:hypothetical protein
MLLNAYCTHRAPPEPSFPHVLRGRRDRDDPELAGHLNGFMGYVMGGGRRKMNATRFHVLQHLERVRHHLSMEVDERHLDAFATWARAANAIVFTPDGVVRTPEGAVLVAADTGDAAPGVDAPYPDDAVARKARTMRDIEGMGVRVVPSLPPVVGATEVELRSPSEVARRCLALFVVALRAESLGAGDGIPIDDLRARAPLGVSALTPKELAFVEAAAPSKQEVVQHVWRYESLALLAWATSVVPALPPASGICDVPALAKAMLALDAEAFVRDATLRPVEPILDALDLHYRLHWATTEARARKQPAPSGLEPGVVFERHYALNWLTGFQSADWDDVETPT